MQLKKLVSGVLVVVGLFVLAFAVNNANLSNKQEAYATTTVSHNSDQNKDLTTTSQARSYLAKKYGDAGWEKTSYTHTKNGNDYWTFVASKDNQSGLVKAGHTLYVHVDGSVVY